MLSVCSAHSPAFEQREKPASLLTYVDSLGWDPVLQGPLLAIEPGQVVASKDGDIGLEGLGRRLVKVGGVSVFAPTTRYVPPNFDSLTVFDYLNRSLKVTALLATLSEPEFERLNQTGLCANDLTGDARLALLALVPERMDVAEGDFDDHGTQIFHPRTIDNSADRANVKFRLQRVVDIDLSHNPGDSLQGTLNFSSLDVQRAQGSPSLTMRNLEWDLPKVSERQIQMAAAEKVYEFNWQDRRLTHRFELMNDEPVGQVIGRIRGYTQLEIYADERIATLKLHSIGKSSDCASVLHALAIATDGVIRPVGPAFILAEDLEGEATAEARSAGQEFQARRQIEPLITGWIQNINGRGLYPRIGFSGDDPMANALYPGGYSGTDLSKYDQCPLSSWPPVFQSIVKDQVSEQANQYRGRTPTFSLATASTRVTAVWRIPDGRTVSSPTLFPTPGIETDPPFKALATSPVDPSKFEEGSAIEISPPDMDSATAMVKSLIGYGFEEVWIDSTDPAVVAAATLAGGGHVDVVIRPWRALKGEIIDQPDINVVGLTGAQVAALTQGNLDRRSDSQTFSNTFIPSDPGLERHWSKLLDLIPKSGVRRIIVLDPVPGGYGPSLETVGVGSVVEGYEGDRFSFGALADHVQGLNDFGYSLAARLQFLRDHHLDPVDLIIGAAHRESFPKGSAFQYDNRRVTHTGSWNAERHRIATEAISGLREHLQTLPCEVCYPAAPHKEQGWMDVQNGPRVVVSVNGKGIELDWLGVGPDFSENESGKIVDQFYVREFEGSPVCIDFRVPPKDFNRYLQHYFVVPREPATRGTKGR